MFHCPRCRTHLEREESPNGVQWRCPTCEGRSVTLGVLRRIVSKPAVNSLWQTARQHRADSGLPCPLCANAMTPVQHFDAIEVDVCTTCQSVWFDPAELEHAGAAAPAPPPVDEKELSPRAKEIIALAQIKLQRERAEAEDDVHGMPPNEGWQTILTIFGIPIEQDAPPIQRWPWVTWLVLLLMTATTIWTEIYAPDTYKAWGSVASDPWRHYGFNFVASFFLHGGWWHLFGNAAFLYVFGDNVEDFLGHWRYALLLILSSMAGDFLHFAFAPDGTIPLVGASGGISGVIVFYALTFPRAKLVYFLRVGFIFRWIRIPAWGGLALWIGLQALGVFEQLAGVSNVSSLGHLGGAAVGLIAWLLARYLPRMGSVRGVTTRGILPDTVR